MLSEHLVKKINEELNVEPTPSQVELINNLADYTINGIQREVLIVKGYAGTGKTMTLSAYVRVLKSMGIKFFLIAPTGRAAKVLTQYSGFTALTIHKKIYRQQSAADGFGLFGLNKNLTSNSIFIVDESSMISNQKQEGNIFGSGFLLNDLLEYIFGNKNCKLIVVGDTAQLPPVNLSISPALNKDEVEILNYSVREIELTDVVRQDKDSGILLNATILRQRIQSENFRLPLLNIGNFADIVCVRGDELIESITNSYSNSGIDETLVICRSNKRANQYNMGIRNSVLWREEELSSGDLLMAVKNNYFWLKDVPDADFIANGDIMEVLKVRNTKEIYGFRFADCLVKLVDYDITLDVKLILDSLHSESAALNSEQNKNLFYSIMEDYAHLTPKKKQYNAVKENEFFNAIQVKYAYAVTCHKAQGGQWKEIYIDTGYLTEERIDKEYLRWLYTAITRSTSKAYLVNFPEFLTGQEKN